MEPKVIGDRPHSNKKKCLDLTMSADNFYFKETYRKVTCEEYYKNTIMVLSNVSNGVFDVNLKTLADNLLLISSAQSVAYKFYINIPPQCVEIDYVSANKGPVTIQIGNFYAVIMDREVYNKFMYSRQLHLKTATFVFKYDWGEHKEPEELLCVTLEDIQYVPVQLLKDT